MLQGFFVLLACQLAGEAIVRVLGAPFPGPVAGMVVLFAYLSIARRGGARDRPDGPVGLAADGLLRYLGLLFVPAGVGVARSYDLIIGNGMAILAALVASTVATLVVTVGVFRMVRRLQGKA